MPDDKSRPRILLITRNLPPLVGGMERLNWHMADELAKGADVQIIGPEGSAALAPENIQVTEVPLVPLWRFLWAARRSARRETRTWRPDFVLAGSGLTAPIARSAARICGARFCVYVHGLDIAVRHRVYRAVWIPAIRKADLVIANSSATAELCSQIGIRSAQLGIVHPGVNLPAPLDAEAAAAASRDFRARHGLGNRPILLAVGRLSVRKGLREFVTNSLPRIVAARPDAILLVVGDAPRQALHADAQTPESILAAADSVGVEAHIKFLGAITNYELGSAYRAANLHVFPVRKIPGDPEGFGMVAIEAAAHGLPTVAFASGGVVDAVSEGVSGRFVASGDYAGFTQAILDELADLNDARAVRARNFAQQFAWPEFGKRIRANLERVA